MANLLKVTYPDAKSGESRKSSKWYGQYRDARGKVCRTPLSTDKTVSHRMLRDLLTKIDRAKAGIDDRHAEFRNVPLTAHLEAYRATFADKGHTEAQAMQSVKRCATIFEGCGFELLADLDADAVSAWLGSRRALAKVNGGIGLQTSNHYAAAAKARTSRTSLQVQKKDLWQQVTGSAEDQSPLKALFPRILRPVVQARIWPPLEAHEERLVSLVREEGADDGTRERDLRAMPS